MTPEYLAELAKLVQEGELKVYPPPMGIDIEQQTYDHQAHAGEYWLGCKDLIAEVERLREVLEWYRMNVKTVADYGATNIIFHNAMKELLDDAGQRARDALERDREC